MGPTKDLMIEIQNELATHEPEDTVNFLKHCLSEHKTPCCENGMLEALQEKIADDDQARLVATSPNKDDANASSDSLPAAAEIGTVLSLACVGDAPSGLPPLPCGLAGLARFSTKLAGGVPPSLAVGETRLSKKLLAACGSQLGSCAHPDGCVPQPA